MRALKERMAFAGARVLRVIDAGKAMEAMSDALDDVFTLGYNEAGYVTQKDVPVMFADEELLVDRWVEGFRERENELIGFFTSSCVRRNGCYECSEDQFEWGCGCSHAGLDEAFELGGQAFVNDEKIPQLFLLDEVLSDSWRLGFNMAKETQAWSKFKKQVGFVRYVHPGKMPANDVLFN